MMYLRDLNEVQSRLPALRNHLGVGFVGQYYIAVTHDEKALALYRHIKSAKTYSPRYDFPRSFDEWYPDVGLIDRGSNIIAVQTGASVVGVGCKNGSGCLLEGEYFQVFNLYWALIFMSTETGVNLLKYDMIWFYSQYRDYTTIIEFKCDRASKLFRAKMVFDIGGEPTCSGKIL